MRTVRFTSPIWCGRRVTVKTWMVLLSLLLWRILSWSSVPVKPVMRKGRMPRMMTLRSVSVPFLTWPSSTLCGVTIRAASQATIRQTCDYQRVIEATAGGVLTLMGALLTGAKSFNGGVVVDAGFNARITLDHVTVSGNVPYIAGSFGDDVGMVESESSSRFTMRASGHISRKVLTIGSIATGVACIRAMRGEFMTTSGNGSAIFYIVPLRNARCARAIVLSCHQGARTTNASKPHSRSACSWSRSTSPIARSSPR